MDAKQQANNATQVEPSSIDRGHPRKLLNAAYVKLLLAEYLFQFGMYTVTPITANYATLLGADLAGAGFLAGLSAGCAMVSRPFLGPLFARFEQKRLLQFGALVFTLSSLICVVAPFIPILGASRLCFGVSIVFKTTLVVAMGASLSPESKTGQAIAWIGLGNVIGMALGPVIATSIIAFAGYTAVYMTSSALFVCAFALVSSLPPSPLQNGSTRKDGNIHSNATPLTIMQRVKMFVHVRTLPLTGITIFEGFVFGTVSTLTLLVCEQRAIQGSAAFFVLYAVVAFLVRPLSSRLYDTFGFLKISVPVTASMAASLFMLAFAHSTAPLLISAVLFAIGQGCLWPCLQAESVVGVPDEERTLAANTFYMGPDIGMTLGPIISGAIMQLGSSTLALLVNFVVTVLLLLLLVPYHRWKTASRAD